MGAAAVAVMVRREKDIVQAFRSAGAVSGARGRTVEIGSGTGLNLPYHPDDLDELVLIEPDAAMRSRLEKSMRRRGRRGRVVDAPAEHLPFAA